MIYLWEEVIFQMIYQFNDQIKKELEIDILKDFEHGYEGILKFPKNQKWSLHCLYLLFQFI